MFVLSAHVRTLKSQRCIAAFPVHIFAPRASMTGQPLPLALVAAARESESRGQVCQALPL